MGVLKFSNKGNGVSVSQCGRAKIIKIGDSNPLWSVYVSDVYIGYDVELRREAVAIAELKIREIEGALKNR